MSDVDPELAAAAVAAITTMSKHATKQQKEHFVEVLIKLAECYCEDAKTRALVLVCDDDSLYSMSVNADQWDAAGMIQLCYENMNLKAFQKMPEHYHAH